MGLQMGFFVFGRGRGMAFFLSEQGGALDVTRTGSHPSIQMIFKSRSSSHLPVALQQDFEFCVQLGKEVIKDLTPDAFGLI